MNGLSFINDDEHGMVWLAVSTVAISYLHILDAFSERGFKRVFVSFAYLRLSRFFHQLSHDKFRNRIKMDGIHNDVEFF